MKKVLLIAENDFEDREFTYPYYRLQESGYKVDIVGPKAKEQYKGKYGLTITSDYLLKTSKSMNTRQ